MTNDTIIRQLEQAALDADALWFAAQDDIERLERQVAIAVGLNLPLRRKIARLEAQIASANIAETVIGIGKASRPMGGMMPVPTLLEQIPPGVISKSRVYDLAKSGEIVSCQSDGRLYLEPSSFRAAARKAAARKGLRLVERDGQLFAEPI